MDGSTAAFRMKVTDYEGKIFLLVNMHLKSQATKQKDIKSFLCATVVFIHE
jgi:hypothetical protein